MTVTAPAEVRRDAKAGYCGRCRNGQHALCASPPDRCSCPRRGEHPNRPEARTPATEKPAAAAPDSPLDDVRARAQATGSRTPATGPKAKLREPVWELVKAEPPAPPPKPRKITAEDRTRRFVEQLVAEGDRDWHRFAVFPSSMAAGQVRARVAKRFPEFEFKAVRVADIGQSALYGRWTGTKPRGQL